MAVASEAAVEVVSVVVAEAAVEDSGIKLCLITLIHCSVEFGRYL